MRLHSALAAMILLAPATASAHTGHGDTSGFAHGFMHPLSGIDHLLAMFAVGLFAFRLGGRALWAVPAAFVGMMAVGGVLGFEGVGLPFVETGIALSVLALGMAVATGITPPVAIAAALVGFFAIFHGHAHGGELPAGAGAAGYTAGFLAATALLHAAGIGAAALAAGRFALVRFGGAAVALAGVGLLVGL
ncbi:MAG: urease accessory protein [Alphaproteobacteria bacterium]|nr:urease accessory protein [Alphaproteobacteria bacterium]